MYVNGYIGAEVAPPQQRQGCIDYVNRIGLTAPFVIPEDGGERFCTLNGFSYGGNSFVITPDKKIINAGSYAIGGAQILTSQGVQPHNCSGGGDVISPTITISAPAANAVLKSGTVQDVTWSASDNVGVVSRAIKLSTNNGTSYSLLDSASCSSGTGTYKWTVPAQNASQCIIKIAVYDAARNTKITTSGVFKISTTDIKYNPQMAVDLVKFKITSESYMVYIPLNGYLTVSISDGRGKLLSSFTTTGNSRWYTLPESMNSGMHIVSIKNSNTAIVKKICIAK